MLYLLNAFSLNMVPPGAWAVVVVPIAEEQLRKAVSLVEWESAIGHAEIANFAWKILGREVLVRRVTVRLTPEDEAVVFQYQGPRLPEGATTLPPGATLSLYYLKIFRPEEVSGQSDMIFLLPPHFRV